MPINKQLVLEQWESEANSAWIIIQNTKNESPVVIPGAGEASDNPDARWKVHMSIDIERMGEAIPLIIDELNKEDSPNLCLKFATKTLLSKESQAAKEVAIIIPPEVLTEENLPRLQSLFQNIANALSAKGIYFDERPINSDQIEHPTKWDKPLLYDGGAPSYFSYRDGQVVVLDDALYFEMASMWTNTFRGRHSKQCLVKQSYFQSLPESRRHNPEGASDPLSRLIIEDSLSEEEKIFCRYHGDQLNSDTLLQRLDQAIRKHDEASPMYQAAQLVREEAENLSHVMPERDLKKWKMSVVLALNVLETPKTYEVGRRVVSNVEHEGKTTIQSRIEENPEYSKAVRLLKANADHRAIGKSDDWKRFKGALAMLAGTAIIGLSVAGIPFTGGASLAGFYVAGGLLTVGGGAAFFYHNRQKSLAKETAALAREANKRAVA